MKSYHDMLRHVRQHGVIRKNRTGVDTQGVFGYQWRHDLRQGFPLLTTKKLHTRSIIVELIWFILGRTDNAWLKEHGCSIWDEWVKEDGTFGPAYGHQWRRFGDAYRQCDETDLLFGPLAGVDQIHQLVETLRNDPNSRRMLVSAWNPLDVPKMALPPCHALWQCYVEDGCLSLHLYQRSADLFLGVPFNIASYAMLTHMLAQVTGLKVGDIIVSYGDLHIYTNHFEQVELQLSREERPLPTLLLDLGVKHLEDFRENHFSFLNYNPHPSIKAPVAV